MSKWWDDNVGMASQGLGSDPTLALDAATVPPSLIQPKTAKPDENQGREEDYRPGFIKALTNGAAGILKSADDALSSVGGGAWKYAKQGLLYPVDKVATAWHWAYSEAFSQPLSTLFLQSAKSDLGVSSFFDLDEIKQSYREAENISPGQAFMNYENVKAASGDPGAFAPLLGLSEAPDLTSLIFTGEDWKYTGHATQAEQNDVKRNTERFLYDSKFWEKKEKQKYVVGSGGLDFFFVLFGDPVSHGISAGSSFYKAGANVGLTAAKSGERVTAAGSHTVEEAVTLPSMRKFFESNVNRTPAQIESHPIWGTGRRRKNPHSGQYSQFLAGKTVEEQQLITRFAAGDASALTKLAEESRDVVAQLGRISDNRALVESARLDPEMVAFHAERAMTPFTGASLSSTAEKAGRLMEPPTPRPTTPGPAQQGWDARWGQLSAQAEASKLAAKAMREEAIAGAPSIGTPMQAASMADLAKAEAWRAGYLDTATEELAMLNSKKGFYQGLLGENFERLGSELSPSASPLFGTMNQFYKMGPWAIRNPEKLAAKKWNKGFAERSAIAERKNSGFFGLTSQVVRSGMYATPMRFFTSIGDQLPERFIEHTAKDAGQRVSDMLLQVKGLDPRIRESMRIQYDSAGDKILKSDKLKSINNTVIEHMGAQRGLDASMAREISENYQRGLSQSHGALSGIKNPQEKFGTLGGPDPITGKRIDAMVDGEGWIVAPLLKSQLSRAEPMLDVKELGRLMDRAAGPLRRMRAKGASTADAFATVADMFSGLWKLGALARGGYILRNVTETQMAAAAKLGSLSSVASVGPGMANWFGNRADSVMALAGKGSTGKRVVLTDPEAIKRAEQLGEKVTRIKVPKAIEQVEGVIKTERELLASVDSELASQQAKFDEWLGGRRKAYKNEAALDEASANLSQAYARTAFLRGQVKGVRTEAIGTKFRGVQEERAGIAAVKAAEAETATSNLDELAGLHLEAKAFLKEAERGAEDAATRWGDKSWKYDAAQLDELRAWEAKVATEAKKGSMGKARSAEALKTAETAAKANVAEFEKVMAKLTGDKKWYQAALNSAQRTELEVRRYLGSAAERVHYSDDITREQGVRILEKLDYLKAAKADHEGVIAEYSDYAGDILGKAEEHVTRRIGEGSYSYRGIDVPEAFNRSIDNPLSRDAITSEDAYKMLFSRSEAVLKERFAKTGHWVDITPDQPNHMSEWLRAINLQIGQDDLAKLVIKDPDEALRWSRTTEGQLHLRVLGPHGKDAAELIRKLVLLTDNYIPIAGGIRDKVLKGEQIYRKDLEAALPKEARPVIHGEEVRALLKNDRWNTASGLIDKSISSFFKRFSSIPTDIMANHPIYLRLHQNHTKGFIDQELAFKRNAGLSETMSAKEINDVMHKADTLARRDMSQVVYDPQRTTATESLRFATPFLAAHVDGLQRWSGLIAEKPQLLTTMSKIYEAPVAAQLVTDQSGNVVGSDGYVTIKGPDGKSERKFVSIKDRVFHLRWPGSKREIGAGDGSIPIPIQNMNVILPGDPWFNPGGGPLVQVAGSQIAKASPTTGAFLEWAKILPYGPTDTSTALTPKWMRAAWDRWTAGDVGNEKYQAALSSAYNRNIAEWRKGGSEGGKPSWKQAEAEARNFMFFQAVTAFFSPAQTRETPTTGTPLQFYIDQYRQMQVADPKNADDLFYARHGADLFSLTTSLSKSIGIAPTMEGVYASEEFSKELADDPDLAGFIMSKSDNGKFSNTAYSLQMEQYAGDRRVREKLTARQAAEANEAQLGWLEYNKKMNLVDSLLLARGFKSYEENGAEQFALLKKGVTASLGQQYPSWDEARQKIDSGAIKRRIKSFESLTKNPKLASDPMRTDVQVMAKYLQMRSLFKTALTERGLEQLSFGVSTAEPGTPEAAKAATGQAEDLGRAWRQVQMAFVNMDTGFADHFHRYLENDNLQ